MRNYWSGLGSLISKMLTYNISIGVSMNGKRR